MTSSPLPWKIDEDRPWVIRDAVGHLVISGDDGPDDAFHLSHEDAKRIVDCVNACQHLEDVAALADLITSAAALTSVEKMKVQMNEKTYEGLRGAALASLGDALKRLHG